MLRRLALFSILFSSLALACGDKGGGGSGDGSGDGDGDGDTNTSSGTDTGGPDSDPACDMYLECVGKVDPDNLQMNEDKYGQGGTCWSEETHEECVDDCMDFTEAYKDDNPNALECGGDELCPGGCCNEGDACNPDFPCCGAGMNPPQVECFLEGATQCLCVNLPNRCNTCMNDCLATMMPPEICEASCKTWCEPNLDDDPINCRSWE